MYADFTTKPSGDADGPNYVSYPELEDVYNLSPSILIDVLPQHVKGGTSSYPAGSFGLANLSDESLLNAVANAHPISIESGDALEFGFNRALVHERERSLNMSGAYTIAWVGRNKTGGGGMFLGSRTASNQSYIGWSYGGESMNIVHAGSAFASWTVGWTVDVWQSGIAVYSSDEDRVYWWRDGVSLGFSSVGEAVWGSGPVMVGGIGDKMPLAFLGGDMAALAVFDGLDMSTTPQAENLAKVQAWLAEVKSRL